MDIQYRGIPFRFVLPVVQLLVCLMLLWPVRAFLLVGVAQSIHSYFGSAPEFRVTSDLKGSNVVVPPATVEEQTRADALIKLLDRRKLAPLTLDFPVLIAQLPYVLMSPTRREWVPKGMFPDIWRAVSWPFAGIFFWWLLGRSVEALFAARQSVVRPHINWAETTFAGILFIVGLVALAGILTSTPDDRRDLQFMAWVAGGLLWGILASATIAARFMQRRIQKQATATQPTVDSTLS